MTLLLVIWRVASHDYFDAGDTRHRYVAEPCSAYVAERNLSHRHSKGQMRSHDARANESATTIIAYMRHPSVFVLLLGTFPLQRKKRPPLLLFRLSLLHRVELNHSTPAAVTVRSTIGRLRRGQQETG